MDRAPMTATDSTPPVSPGISEQALNEIETLPDAYRAADGWWSKAGVGVHAIDEIPRLVAAVRRQRTEIERLTAGIEEVTAKFEEFIATLPSHIQSQIRLGSSHG